ncbi:MAG: DUF2298 domain-containing protein [Rudaea sp.]
MAVAQSLLHALAWWLTLACITGAGWLVLRPATAAWHDRGWVLAKQLGIVACAFAVFVAAHLMPAFQGDVLRVAFVVFAAVVLPWRRRALRIDRSTLRALAAGEARFAAAFAFYVAMRGFSHDVIGLEKFMDYGFAASAMRTATLPVPDPWFAGLPINYYYFGHFVTAFLCKLSGTPLAYGYNLMLATLFASVFALAYALVAEIGRAAAPAARTVMAYVAGLWLTLGGNVHGFWYGFIRPWLVDLAVLAPPRQAFLLSDPTRFVGWNPPTDDRLIHEFPAYAFYVGDLHAHLLNLPSVLLLCGVLLAWLRVAQAAPPRDSAPLPGRGLLVVAGALVGVFAMANSWDALMYGVLVGTLLALRGFGAFVRGARAVRHAVADGVVAAIACAAAALPFLVHFDAHGEGFLPTHSHTPAWQWLILYGLQTLLALAGCALAWRARSGVARPERTLLFLLAAFGIAFALVPEFVYLKDIYGGAFYRGNTAFKFGFQAFTLLTLAACVGVALVVSNAGARVPRAATALLFEIALVPPLYYAWFVLQGAFGVWHEREWTLDGQRYLARNYPEDLAVSRWLAGHSPPGATLIEAVGDSYSYAARISTNSGVPAVLGWPVHEQLWRGSDPLVWKRRDDVNALYAAKSAHDAQRIIDRYGARWLVVGRYEHERYRAALDANLVRSLGTVAFRAGETFVVDLAGGPAALAGR